MKRRIRDLSYRSSKFVLRFTNPVNLHCLGDSHVKVFKHMDRQYFWMKTRFQTCIVYGATATGLDNPNSQTKAYSIYRAYLEKLPVTDHLLFCLGEVDCGFVIWYRAQKYGDSVNRQMELALFNYIQLINDCRRMGFEHITLCSVPLPTILDNQDWGDIANQRKEVKATIRERTNLTVQFNRKIREFCRTYHYHFLDFEKDTLDPNTGIVRESFRNADRTNHHLSRKELSEVIVPKLKELGYS